MLVNQGQVVQVAVEKTLIGENRNTVSACLIIAGGNRQRIKVFCDNARGRRSAFNLGDKPEWSRLQRQPEIAEMPMTSGAFLPVFGMIQPRGDLLAFVSDNLGKPTHKVMGKGSVRVMEYRSDDVPDFSRVEQRSGRVRITTELMIFDQSRR